jgi:hypothetical protein
MPTNTLTITGINAAKPREKPYKLSDGGGMYLLVNPQGSMYWRLSDRQDTVLGSCRR